MRRRTRGLMTQSLAWPGLKCCRQINQSNIVQSTTRITETGITNPTRITDKRATTTSFMY